MLGQASFSDLEYANKKRRTRRELFLAEMDAVVPCPELLAVVERHYPRTGAVVRRSVWPRCCGSTFSSSGSPCRTASDRTGSTTSSLRRFAGFPNVTAALPDETTIPNFRHLWSSTI
jgi:IS5 family transposase